MRAGFLLLYLLIILSGKPIYAQKVAVVLSGGGADGLTHIGVLKALEENNIPVDYIAGTSIGALIGGLYAAGYSPKEIEELTKNKKFHYWANGEIDPKYIYYVRQKESDASWINFKFNADTILQSALPTNLISPVPLDFGMIELFGSSSAMANCNFDSLFVPFFCVASDITAKKATLFTSGDLAQCIRASMSYPFYIKALRMDESVFVDGGLYNNFPVDLAYEQFHPDIIIGATVSENLKAPDEDDLLSQIKSLMINRVKDISVPVPMVLIKPEIGQNGLFDFSNPERLIQNGYDVTNKKMSEIKDLIHRETDTTSLRTKRIKYKNSLPDLNFNYIHITGLKKNQQRYVTKLLGLNKNREQSFADLTAPYYRLASDPKIAQIYPQAHYDNISKFYQLNLHVKKEKNLFASFGGNFSSRPINEAFISAQYNYLGNIGATISANSYFGKFYGSYNIRTRIDFPSRIPYFLDFSFTRNRWDFFRSSTAFFEESKPSYYVQNENYSEIQFGAPMGRQAKFTLGVSSAIHFDRYYQTKVFQANDTTDRTDFLNITPFIKYERNTLNRKQFANKGSLLNLRARYVFGNEITDPGTTSSQQFFTTEYHEWYQFFLHYSDFFKENGHLHMGYSFEMLVSNQSFFANYTASKMASLQFNPIPESRTLFLEQYRAHSYLASGLKAVLNVFKRLDIRAEVYLFQPYREIKQREEKIPYYSTPFSRRYTISSAALVYFTPVGPVSLSANYYSNTEKPLSLLFTFGYLLFNRRHFE